MVKILQTLSKKAEAQITSLWFHHASLMLRQGRNFREEGIA